MKIAPALIVFWLAFLASCAGELACLARSVALISRFGHPLFVCLGTWLGSAVVLIPLVLWGEAFQKALPELAVRIVAGLLFIGMGIFLLLGKEVH